MEEEGLLEFLGFKNKGDKDYNSNLSSLRKFHYTKQL